MKRIISLVLVLCMLFMCGILVSCETQSTFQVISTALDNTQALDYMDATMEMEINMESQGTTMSIPMTADIKANNLKSDNPVMSTEISMSMLGMTVDMKMYQEGEWAYYDALGMKYKTKITEETSEYDYTDDVDSMVQDLPEELFENIELVKGEDGSLTVTVAIPDEQFADIYDDYIDSLNSTTGYEDGDITVTDAKVSITVKDEYLSVYDMSFNMNIDIAGVSSAAEVTAKVTYNNLGEKVTVTPPDGYKDYEEMDPNDMLGGDLGDDLDYDFDLGDGADLDFDI